MNKQSFLTQYEATLKATHPWATDAEKLARFMDSVRETITTQKSTWNHDGEAVTAAWKAIGGKGKPTLKALRALSEGA